MFASNIDAKRCFRCRTWHGSDPLESKAMILTAYRDGMEDAFFEDEATSDQFAPHRRQPEISAQKTVDNSSKEIPPCNFNKRREILKTNRDAPWLHGTTLGVASGQSLQTDWSISRFQASLESYALTKLWTHRGIAHSIF